MMTSIIKLHALSGVMDESPYCYLLQVDEFRFLLDCGWDETFDVDFVKELKKHVHQIDAVLLSFPDHLHLGALPYMVGKCGLSCPIYATIPVYKMGQMFMYDLYQSRHNIEDFDLFTLDDVDAAFDKIIQLKYNQSISLKGKGYGLTITPLPAGHMIGGTIWKIVKVGEEDIVYAVDFNHKKERHLNGCEVDKIQRPSLLITDSYNALYQQARRRTRDEKLMTNILQTLRNGGNVLVAVDTAGRVLELAHMLDQLWRNKESGLLAFSLALLNNVSYNVVEFAKSQIEWMSDKLMRSFEAQRNNPFQFRHLQLCHSLAELSKVPSPKVVLASMPDMECGFSRDLFLQWCQNPRNSIILTSRSAPGTLARSLIEDPGPRTLTLDVKQRVRLEGAELEEYLSQERELQAQRRKLGKGDDIDSSDESGDELDMNAVSKGKHDLLVKPESKSQQGFFKSNKKQFPMFPFFEEKIKFDEYGEVIRCEDYMILDGNPEAYVEESKENGLDGVVAIGGLGTNGMRGGEDDAGDITEVPTKCIHSQQIFQVAAQVQFIDFEGRSDGESLKKLLGQMKPRRLILVRGDPEGTRNLASFAQQWGGAKVFTPTVGEIVDATTETHIYQVRLKESLVSALLFSKGKDAELAWLDGMLSMQQQEKPDVKPVGEQDEGSNGINADTDVEMKDSQKGSDSELIPTLDLLPVNLIQGHNTAFINELKLSDFKQVLNRNGITSEFSGGVLWCCSGTISLRRHEAGRVTLEGCLSDDYYKVRELLYEQYAIV